VDQWDGMDVASRLVCRAMRRTSGAWIGAIVAVAAGGVVASGATRLGAQRAGAQAAYAAALHDVRREAGRTDVTEGAATGEVVCVRGPEGVAAAAARALGTDVRGSDGSLDAAALAIVSRAAFAAARDREDATGAPALPQRMGVVDGASVAMRETCAGEPAWASARVTAPSPSVPKSTAKDSTTKSSTTKSSTKSKKKPRAKRSTP
jgi:hypothetical protein